MDRVTVWRGCSPKLSASCSTSRHACRKPHHKVVALNDRTSYPRFVDRLNEDLLRFVFKIATAEQNDVEMTEDKSEDSGEDTIAIRDFPQVAASVSKRWRAVAFGIPELWSNIRVDHRHPPKWIERCVSQWQMLPPSRLGVWPSRPGPFTRRGSSLKSISAHNKAVRG